MIAASAFSYAFAGFGVGTAVGAWLCYFMGRF